MSSKNQNAIAEAQVVVAEIKENLPRFVSEKEMNSENFGLALVWYAEIVKKEEISRKDFVQENFGGDSTKYNVWRNTLRNFVRKYTNSPEWKLPNISNKIEKKVDPEALKLSIEKMKKALEIFG